MANKVTSSIVAEEETKTHVIKIDGYSRIKKQLKDSKTTSIPFVVGDHNWVVDYYPNGYKAPGYISVFLVLDSADAKDVKAQFTLSVLDKRGQSVPSYVKATQERIYPKKGSNWGFAEFINLSRLLPVEMTAARAIIRAI